MKKLIGLLILFFVLGGCGPSTIQTDADFKTGHDALILSFIDDYGEEVYEGEFIPLKIKIENKGAYDIKSSITNMAIEEDYLELMDYSIQDFELKGKSNILPNGEQDVILYNLKAKQLEEQSVLHTTNTYITACYVYETDFSQDVCIDSDIYNINTEKICEPQDIHLGSGQGGPLGVDKIESRMLYDSEKNLIFPQFIFYIRNKGNGNIIRANSIETVCSAKEINREDMNVFTMQIKIFEEGELLELNCIPDTLKLRDEEIKVICKNEKGIVPDKGNYITSLHIHMDYGYSTSISKEITIQKVIP